MVCITFDAFCDILNSYLKKIKKGVRIMTISFNKIFEYFEDQKHDVLLCDIMEILDEDCHLYQLTEGNLQKIVASENEPYKALARLISNADKQYNPKHRYFVVENPIDDEPWLQTYETKEDYSFSLRYKLKEMEQEFLDHREAIWKLVDDYVYPYDKEEFKKLLEKYLNE